MDPDPRYWDDEFAKTTKFGGIITPPIYCTYIGRKPLAGTEDPVTRAFRKTRTPTVSGVSAQLPGSERRTAGRSDVSKRILNAGNEIEVRQYPKLGDRIYSQAATPIQGARSRRMARAC